MVVEQTNRVIQAIAKSEGLDLVVFEDVVFASSRDGMAFGRHI